MNNNKDGTTKEKPEQRRGTTGEEVKWSEEMLIDRL